MFENDNRWKRIAAETTVVLPVVLAGCQWKKDNQAPSSSQAVSTPEHIQQLLATIQPQDTNKAFFPFAKKDVQPTATPTPVLVEEYPLSGNFVFVDGIRLRKQDIMGTMEARPGIRDCTSDIIGDPKFVVKCYGGGDKGAIAVAGKAVITVSGTPVAGIESVNGAGTMPDIWVPTCAIAALIFVFIVLPTRIGSKD